MAGRAMAQPLGKIGAAIPGRGLPGWSCQSFGEKNSARQTASDPCQP